MIVIGRIGQNPLAKLALLGLVVACSRGQGQEPEPLAIASRSAAAPASGASRRLRLETTRLEIGQMQLNEPSKAALRVMNDGNSPLFVERIEPSPRCSASIDPETVPAHGSATVEVTCKTDLWGSLKEQLTLRSNDPANAITKLEIVGEVVPLLAFDSSLVHQEMRFGESRVQDTRLIGKLAREAKLALLPVGNSAVDVQVLPTDRNEPAGLRLRCKGDRVGGHVGQVTVLTGLLDPAEVQLSWSCKVLGTLEVNPTNPYFNLKVSGPLVMLIDVRSKQVGFQLLAVHIKQGPYRASIVPGDPPEHPRVKVEFADELHLDDRRGVAGTLVIRSNDRTEPVKEIALTALGKRNRAVAPEP